MSCDGFDKKTALIKNILGRYDLIDIENAQHHIIYKCLNE
jgi:hypothetical protein